MRHFRKGGTLGWRWWPIIKFHKGTSGCTKFMPTQYCLDSRPCYWWLVGFLNELCSTNYEI